MNTIPLYKLKKGESGTIINVEDNPYKMRMLELGFIRGENITMIRKSPIGDPTAYFVKGTVVALRKAQAGYINVILISESDLSEKHRI
ncbi:MAG: FeoA family protein [Eubacteriales bacterium]|nr:FeoA family protein [Eubacteriales bacterium]